MKRELRLDPRAPAVLPVIHHLDLVTTRDNNELCQRAGTDGVFLIDHYGRNQELLAVAAAVRAADPDLWIGVNLLGERPADVFRRVAALDLDGIWTDHAGVDLAGNELAERALEAREAVDWNGLYFGGVQFKYQAQLADDERAAAVAARYMDVICTSGPGTGEPPELAKLARLTAGASGTPLAVASGVTPANAAGLRGLVHAVLVATGISRDFHHLDPERTRQLVATLRA